MASELQQLADNQLRREPNPEKGRAKRSTKSEDGALDQVDLHL